MSPSRVECRSAQLYAASANKVYHDSEPQYIVGRIMGRFLCRFYDSRTQHLYLCVSSTAPALDILLFAIKLMDRSIGLKTEPYSGDRAWYTSSTTNDILLLQQLNYMELIEFAWQSKKFIILYDFCSRMSPGISENYRA